MHTHALTATLFIMSKKCKQAKSERWTKAVCPHHEGRLPGKRSEACRPSEDTGTATHTVEFSLCEISTGWGDGSEGKVIAFPDSRTHLESRIHLKPDTVTHSHNPSQILPNCQVNYAKMGNGDRRSPSSSRVSEPTVTHKHAHTHITYKDKKLNIIKIPQQPSTETK
jgi:hypothetical protein